MTPATGLMAASHGPGRRTKCVGAVWRRLPLRKAPRNQARLIGARRRTLYLTYALTHYSTPTLHTLSGRLAAIFFLAAESLPQPCASSRPSRILSAGLHNGSEPSTTESTRRMLRSLRGRCREKRPWKRLCSRRNMPAQAAYGSRHPAPRRLAGEDRQGGSPRNGSSSGARDESAIGRRRLSVSRDC